MDKTSIIIILLRLFFLTIIKIFLYYYKKDQTNNKQLNITTRFIILIIILCFIINKLLLFYIFFELSLIPIFFIIIQWGYQIERITASFYIIIYTLTTSLPFLAFVTKNNNNFTDINTNDYNKWNIFLLLPFLVKLPIYILHLWLPKAHLEAPTIGSIILAGVLLKLGGFGIYRIIFRIKLKTINYMLILNIIIWGCLLSCLICIRQNDIKRIIAYSSIRHMGLVVFSLNNINRMGLKPFLIIIISHAFCSSGLFYTVGAYQEKKNRRQIKTNRGLNINILFFILFFILLISNFSMPPSINFLGELLIIINIINWNYIYLFIVIPFIFLVSLYCIFIFTNTNLGKDNYNKFLNITSTNLTINLYHITPIILWIIFIKIICLFSLTKT